MLLTGTSLSRELWLGCFAAALGAVLILLRGYTAAKMPFLMVPAALNAPPHPVGLPPLPLHPGGFGLSALDGG